MISFSLYLTFLITWHYIDYRIDLSHLSIIHIPFYIGGNESVCILADYTTDTEPEKRGEGERNSYKEKEKPPPPT